MRKKLFGLFYESIYKGIPVLHISQSKPQSTVGRLVQFVKFHLLTLWVGLRIPKYDIVLAPSPPLTMGLVAIALAKLKGAKAVYNVQEIYPDLAVNEGTLGNPFLIKFLKYLERFIYNHCFKIVTIDPLFSSIIEDRIKNRNKLVVIPNFIDTDLYRPEERTNLFSRQFGLDGYFVVGYVGNVGAYQDWEIILSAAEKLREEKIRFMIVGDGRKKAWIREQIAMRALDNILLIDYQPREMIAFVNASADIHTITMTEASDLNGLPSKIFAIMASGRIIVAATSRESAISRIILEAACGMRVNLGDTEDYVKKIKNAMLNKEETLKQAENGRRYVEGKYSKEVVTNKYFEILTGN